MTAISAFSEWTPFQIQQLTNQIERIAPSLELLPGVAIINSAVDGSVLYMNSKGLHQLQTTLEAIRALGARYHEQYFNPEQAAEYVPRLMDMIQKKDFTQEVTFFQQVYIRGYKEWQWHLTSVRPFCQDAEGRILAVISLAHHISPENHYTRKVDRLLEELTFLKENTAQFTRLGKREKEVLRMIVQGKTCSEIGQTLFISNRTAETHRRNIRRKLGAHNQQELDRFARAFDLV